MIVKPWMQKDLITLQPEDSIASAFALMEENRIRRIPVVDDNNTLLGIISKEDLRKALPSAVDASLDETARTLANQIEVNTFMTHAPVTVSPSDNLEKIAALMHMHKIGGIPVVEETILVGIITESDIFEAFVEVLGGNNKDTRIELTIDSSKESIYKIFEVLDTYNSPLNNIAICNNYSVQARTVMLRIKSDQTQTIIDNLWDIGCKIHSIIHDD